MIDQVAEELRHSDFVPLAFELAVRRKNGALPAVTISEPDGELRVGGKVDRVDGWIQDGKLYLRVVDYKSGKKTFDLASGPHGTGYSDAAVPLCPAKGGGGIFRKRDRAGRRAVSPRRDEILSSGAEHLAGKLCNRSGKRRCSAPGCLLAEPAVLQAMEHESLTEPHYLPLRVSAGRTALRQLLPPPPSWESWGAYVDRLLGQISDELCSGNIDADPCCHSEEDSQCRFCDWVSACQFRDGRDRTVCATFCR
ncbi:MAG: PD-(D/E)XK nuclease family protein [Dysosmobacter sp.]